MRRFVIAAGAALGAFALRELAIPEGLARAAPSCAIPSRPISTAPTSTAPAAAAPALAGPAAAAPGLAGPTTSSKSTPHPSLQSGDPRSQATSALSWVRLAGTDACITTPELGARIEKHLGRPALVSPSVADVSIEGHIEARGTGAAKRYRIVVGGTRRDGTPIGTRELISRSTDCRELDDGLVLVIALMIDPNAVEPAHPPDAPPATLPALPTEVKTERVIVHEIERIPASSSPWFVDAWLGGVSSVDRLPGTTVGAAAGLRVGPSRLVAFELTLGTTPSEELALAARKVTFSIFEAGLAYCPSLPVGKRLELGGCAGLRIGALRAKPEGFATNTDVDRALLDVALGPRVAIGLSGPVFFLAGASLLVPLVRQETTANTAAGDLLVLHDRDTLGAEFGFGFGLRFSP